MPTLRQQAASLFLSTLQTLDIPTALRSRIATKPLTIDGQPYPNVDRILLIALGKAATPMAKTALELLPHAEGILVSPTPLPGLRYFPASHPMPTQQSLDAAKAILDLLSTATPTTLVLFLISGGASAMVEQPLDAAFTLEDTIALNRALVHSGLPIAQMNTLRKHFSAVKGGRLALAAAPAWQHTLLISDVPANQLEIIASGPSLPDPTTVEDCRRILPNVHHLPEALHAYFAAPTLEETPKPNQPAFAKARWSALLSSEDLCQQAASLANAAGFHTVIDNTCDDWDHREAANYLLARLAELRQTYPRVCLLSAGELSVQLPRHHGTGGRNQQFALECARLIASNRQPTAVLSGGSDGIDGNSSAAGAVVDQTTWHRAHNPQHHLETYDAHPLFAALGDTIQTGPTNNNLRDLRILLAAE